MIAAIHIKDVFRIVQVDLKPWRGLILHCTVVPDKAMGVGKHVGVIVDKSHSFHRRFRYGMGYHFLINVDGVIEVGDRWILQLMGAHTRGKNRTHLGVAWVLDGDRETPEPEQWAALKELWNILAHQFSWNINHLSFHRDWTNKKTCPGKLIQKLQVTSFLEKAYDEKRFDFPAD